jgi:voltage-gated potassium channel
MRSGRWLRWRRRAYEILEAGRGEDRASRVVDGLLVLLILANIAAFCAETVPELQSQYRLSFQYFETACMIIFTVEYASRLWASVEFPFLSRMPAWKARLQFAMRPAQVIDLLAILPFYVGHAFGIDLRVLRVLRLLRFLKLSRYSPALYSLIRVLSNERRALMGAGLLLFAAVLFASTGIYFIEGQVQPEKFGSVPASAWWAVATLTTVGYGDVTPVTPFGKLFGGMVMVAGLCILALPVAIISTGFAQEVGRRDFVVTWSLMSRIPLLAELDASDVERIMPLLHAHNLPPNVEIVSRGASADAMYFIASGRVRARSRQGEHSYQTGELFGMMAMLEHDASPATFLTASKCRLLKLYREDFHRLEATCPVVAAHLRKVGAADRTECVGAPTTEGSARHG